MRVLIPQVNRYASIGLIKMLRNVRGLDIEIFGCDPIRLGEAAGTLLVDRFIQSPPLVEEGTPMGWLENICSDYAIDLVIPFMGKEIWDLTGPDYVLPSKVVLPSRDVIELFFDKARANEAIFNLGIRTPPLVSDFFSGPRDVIIRKKHSVGSKGILFLDLDKEQMIPNWFHDDAFAQERIHGAEYTVDVFCNANGDPLIVIPRRRMSIREGVSIACKLENRAELIAAVDKIYESFKIPGFSCVQFIASENVPYFIELNPRIGGTAIAGAIGSFNYMSLFLRHFVLGEKLEDREHYMQQVIWGSVVTRYYEEVVYSSGKSKVQ